MCYLGDKRNYIATSATDGVRIWSLSTFNLIKYIILENVYRLKYYEN